MWRMANTGDCRLPDWRFQIADWSMLSQQTGSRGSLVDARDRDAFVAGFLAGDDADVAAGGGGGPRFRERGGPSCGRATAWRPGAARRGPRAGGGQDGPGAAGVHARGQGGALSRVP